MLKVSTIAPAAAACRLFLVLAAMAGVLGVAACGQKGSLYLPTTPSAAGRATLPQTLNPAATSLTTSPSANPANNPTTPATATAPAASAPASASPAPSSNLPAPPSPAASSTAAPVS